MQEVIEWMTLILGGYLLGGVMFARLIPKLFYKKDICKISKDGNPGAANVFVNCGIPMGIVCLVLDMLKGFIPVFTAYMIFGTDKLLFTAVMLAPVLGHATAPFNRFHGGKCISTAFGEMIALLPTTFVGFLLAGLYIFFSVIIKINPIRRRSILTFTLFGTASSAILLYSGKFSIALGCMLISVIAVSKHLRSFSTEAETVDVQSIDTAEDSEKLTESN